MSSLWTWCCTRMDPVRCAALLTLILLLAACSFFFDNCRNLKKEVCGICLYYQNTTNDDDYLNQIRKDTIIFHFSLLFYSGCSTLSRILVCSRLYPFCSTCHSIVLLPCQQVCFSVYTTWKHVLTAHHQQWPEFLNCSLFPSPSHWRFLLRELQETQEGSLQYLPVLQWYNGPRRPKPYQQGHHHFSFSTIILLWMLNAIKNFGLL